MNPFEIEYPDDSLSFLAGVEIGVMYARAHTEHSPVIATIHTINRDALQSLCIAIGWTPTFGKTTTSRGCLDLIDVTMVRQH